MPDDVIVLSSGTGMVKSKFITGKTSLRAKHGYSHSGCGSTFWSSVTVITGFASWGYTYKRKHVSVSVRWSRELDRVLHNIQYVLHHQRVLNQSLQQYQLGVWSCADPWNVLEDKKQQMKQKHCIIPYVTCWPCII